MSASPDAGGGRAVPFVTHFRSRPGVVTLGDSGGERCAVRVQLPEQWDTVAFDARRDVPVDALKRAALAQFALVTDSPDEYVLKLRGVEVSDESVTLEASGARDGSIFLITNRRRRPVR